MNFSELIKILKEAGLKGTKVGVESADASVMSDANRFTIDKDEQYQKIRELEKNKIQVSAMFILGFPSDTEDSMSNTIKYAKNLIQLMHNLAFGHLILALQYLKNIRIKF